MEEWLLWLILAVVFGVGEILTLGFFLAPFAGGAAVAAVVSAAGLWVGLFAPKGTPAPIVSTIAAAVDKAGASPEFNAAIANIGLEPGYLSAADFTKFWDEDANRSDDAVRQIGKVQVCVREQNTSAQSRGRARLPSPREAAGEGSGVGGA